MSEVRSDQSSVQLSQTDTFRVLAASGTRTDHIRLRPGDVVTIRLLDHGRYDMRELVNSSGTQLALLEPIPPRCDLCGERAPFGDARLPWLAHHDSILHRALWSLKRRLR